jgi:hypothetical protein
MAVFDILDAWELLGDSPRLQRFSMTDWSKIAEAIAAVPALSEPALGSVHLGLSRGTGIAEGREEIAPLAPYAVMFETVWLPDPAYSFLSRNAAKVWQLLPDARGTFFGGQTFGMHWRPVWSAPPSERRQVLLEYLPPILQRLRDLRPLVEAGAIRLQRWEPSLFEQREQLRRLVSGMARDVQIRDLTQRFPQEQYSLGPRAWGLGIAAGENMPGPSPPAPGTPLYFRDKEGIVLAALLNAMLSTTQASSFAPMLAGDRVLYDCLVSGGRLDPKPRPLTEPISLPRFATALLPDLTAIRRDSQTLAIFRSVLKDAAGVMEDAALPSLRERLSEAAAKVSEDASLRKVVKGASADFAVGSLATGLATYVFTSSASVGSIAVGAAAGTVGFLAKLLPKILAKERAEATNRAELIVRISDRL